MLCQTWCDTCFLHQVSYDSDMVIPFTSWLPQSCRFEPPAGFLLFDRHLTTGESGVEGGHSASCGGVRSVRVAKRLGQARPEVDGPNVDADVVSK